MLSKTLGPQKVSLLRQPKGAALRCRQRLCVANKVVLVPTGDGSTEHIGRPITLPGKLVLQPGQQYELGRAEPATVVLPIPTVSGAHALIKVDADNTVTITDLSSTNGTYINGQELAPMKAVTLKQGSEVVFGDKFLAKFRLEVEGDAPAAPAAPAASDVLPNVAEARAWIAAWRAKQ